MNPNKAQPRREPGRRETNTSGRGKGAPSRGRCQHEPPDVFAEARATLTVPDAWVALGLPGEPRRSCRSPFRDERNPSFSIFGDGKGWKDHATGEGGDVVELVRVALNGDYADAREWLMERLGLDVIDGRGANRPTVPAPPPEPPKRIDYPGPLLTLAEPAWRDFARLRALPYPAVWAAVQAGVLRFIKVDGHRCFVVRDEADRAAEIRRIDGEPFGNGRKAYPLAGVDKSWPVGAALLRLEPPETRVLVCEGATDLLAALGLFWAYRRRHGGLESWVPVAVLGAGCRRLHPEAAELMRGRRVRLVFDGDEAGRAGAEAWGDMLAALGCDVEAVLMPDGRDLRDMAEAGEIEPGDLFA